MRIPDLDRILTLDEYDANSLIMTFLIQAWMDNPELVRWTPGQKQFLAIEEMQAQVNNGGYHQYFWNSSGDLVPYCLEGLERIGGTSYRNLLMRAMSLFPEGKVRQDRRARQDLLEEMGDAGEDALNDLSSEYYEMEGIDISAALLELVKMNRHEF